MCKVNRKKISVIVPVYNDPSGLILTIDCLLKQNYDLEKYEILIIDNGSTDRTCSIAKEIVKKNNKVRLFQEKDIQSSYAARNLGISNASGDILCFIDADITVCEDYLQQVEKYFNEKDLDYFGCKVTIQKQDNGLVEKFQKKNSFMIKRYFEESKFFPTCCLSVRKNIFEIVGKFDSRLESGGDFEFGQRVYKKGLRQEYSEKLVLFHPARKTYWALCKKSMRIARGMAQGYFYHPEKYKEKIKKIYYWKNFLPSNPSKIFKEYREMNEAVDWGESILLAFFGIPKNVLAAYAFYKEISKLKRNREAHF